MNRNRSNTSFWKLLAVAVLGLFGVSCGQLDEIFENEERGLVMYGSPTVDYTVNGKVTDEEGNPIKGIKVIAYCGREDDFTTTTSNNGEFSDAFNANQRYPSYIFEDIDGDENGGKFLRDTLRQGDFTQNTTDWKQDDRNPFGHAYVEVTVTKKLKRETE